MMKPHQYALALTLFLLALSGCVGEEPGEALDRGALPG
jgi:hypothetical protein